MDYLEQVIWSYKYLSYPMSMALSEDESYMIYSVISPSNYFTVVKVNSTDGSILA